MNRFGSIPCMLELDHLTVSGDVTFGRGVSLRVRMDNLRRSEVIHTFSTYLDNFASKSI